MEVSIRDACNSCLGKSGTLRVNRDLFGYIFGKIDRDLKIRQHIERIKGKSINICIFLVGYEPGFVYEPCFIGFTLDQAIRVQHAIDLTREIYAQADLGVRKIYWRYIGMDKALPYMSVNSGGATDLTDAFSGPNDGIDVFWVQDVNDAGGWSNSGGPCNKRGKGSLLSVLGLTGGRTGAVLEVSGSSNDFKGILMAHEVGHYLTLRHAGTITNVMGVDSDNDGIGELDNTSRNITSSQRTKMRASCWVRSAC